MTETTPPLGLAEDFPRGRIRTVVIRQSYPTVAFTSEAIPWLFSAAKLQQLASGDIINE